MEREGLSPLPPAHACDAGRHPVLWVCRQAAAAHSIYS